jgi:selenocysteine lyase/cysteine desulfurase
MPGHKGLYGPQGTGLLLCGESTAEPILYGGTGSASRLQEMPEDLPDRLESGTHNMPGIAGLLEGLRFVKRTGMERIGRHERDLAAYAARLLNQVPGVSVFASADLSHQSGVISFRVKDRDCEELAAALSRRAVAVRAGLHCAPLAHKTAGTLEGGTVRISFSAFNTTVQVEAFTGILRQVLREKVTF